jgi:hypothetical protein
LPYILTHPLLASIFKRCAELREQAGDLPEGSAERKKLEKRLSRLEQYRLPKPDARELQQSEPIIDDSGQTIGERHSIRRRFINKRRGRPEEFTIHTRAALEEKLANPGVTWRDLAENHGFQDARTLERAVRILKNVLKSEAIPLPRESDYNQAGNM